MVVSAMRQYDEGFKDGVLGCALLLGLVLVAVAGTLFFIWVVS